jgi:hypothetical protein
MLTSSHFCFCFVAARFGEKKDCCIIIELTEAFAKRSMTFENKSKELLLLCFSLALSAVEAFPVAFPLRQRNTRLCSSEKEQEQRSIGDVVQGLHGGKYQFGDAGMNVEGQQFAEMGYSSGEVQLDNYEDEPIPTWALKLQLLELPSSCPELMLSEGSAMIEIQNDERSWEKYYAFVIGDAALLVVEPGVGMLAPCGGANNFSDTAKLQVRRSGNGSHGSAWLVIGTEAERWTYKLV